MHLIYIDESGNTGARQDPDQPLHLIAGLVVHESKVRSLEVAVERITHERFGPAKLAEGFELHGADLFSGNGHFRGLAPASRIKAVEDVFAALATHEAKVIWTAVNKLRSPSSKHPHQLAFLFLVERIEDYLKSIDSLGLIISDENKEVEQKIIDDLTLYKWGSTNWGYRPTEIKHVVDSVHFVQSVNNNLIQCVDLVAYFALKAHREQSRVPDLWMALAEPRPNFDAFRVANTSAKHTSISDLGKRLWPITISTKVYP